MQKNWKLCILNQQQLWMLAIIIEITGKISTKVFEVLKKINIRPNMQIDMPKTAILKTCSIIGRVLTESSHSTWDTRFSLFLIYIFIYNKNYLRWCPIEYKHISCMQLNNEAKFLHLSFSVWLSENVLVCQRATIEQINTQHHEIHQRKR